MTIVHGEVTENTLRKNAAHARHTKRARILDAIDDGTPTGRWLKHTFARCERDGTAWQQ
jgi:hypothetical protein